MDRAVRETDRSSRWHDRYDDYRHGVAVGLTGESLISTFAVELATPSMRSWVYPAPHPDGPRSAPAAAVGSANTHAGHGAWWPTVPPGR
jgi:hypothetical protein